MNFFQVPKRVPKYAEKGALVGGVACALASIALFIALDRMIAKDGGPSVGLARAVSAMCGAMNTYYSFQAGVVGGAVIGAGGAATYEAGLFVYKALIVGQQETPNGLAP